MEALLLLEMRKDDSAWKNQGQPRMNQFRFQAETQFLQYSLEMLPQYDKLIVSYSP